MANEFTISAAISFVKNNAETISLAQAAKILSQAGVGSIEVPEVSVAITEQAMNVGGLTTLGWCLFKNLDATNFLHIRISTGGSKFIKVPASSGVLFHFGVDVTAPYLIADTGACLAQYILFKP